MAQPTLKNCFPVKSFAKAIFEGNDCNSSTYLLHDLYAKKTFTVLNFAISQKPDEFYRFRPGRELAVKSLIATITIPKGEAKELMKTLLLPALIVMTLSAAGQANAANMGFETGTTSGWTEKFPEWAGRIDVVNHWIEPRHGIEQYSPAEGNYFAVLETGAGNYDNPFTKLSQQFYLGIGDKLEGMAAFCCGEEVGYPYTLENGDYNDYALISVSNGLGNVVGVPWYADSYDIGYHITDPQGLTIDGAYFGPVQWEYWSWTATSPGMYTLEYKTGQGGDAEWNSYAFFDGPVYTNSSTSHTAVPEPSFLALLGIGVAGIAVIGVSKTGSSQL